MKYTVGNTQFIDCVATAISDGDTEPQAAVLIRAINEAPGDADEILFGGWTVKDIAELGSGLGDRLAGEPTSSYQEDLDTVRIDGLPISAYVSGEL